MVKMSHLFLLILGGWWTERAVAIARKRDARCRGGHVNSGGRRGLCGVLPEHVSLDKVVIVVALPLESGLADLAVVADLHVVVEHRVGPVRLLDVLEHALLANKGGAAEGALELNVEWLYVLLEGGSLTEGTRAVVTPRNN